MSIYSEITFDEELEKLVVKMYKNGILAFGNFKFKLHEIYNVLPFLMKLNLRFPPKGNLTEDIVYEIARIFVRVIRERDIEFDLVVGLPRAGEPFAEAFIKIWNDSYSDKKGIIWLEKEEGENHRRILPEIRGEFEKGNIVLLIDDVISLSDSKREATVALRQNDLVVTHAIGVMDWELGGREILLDECGVDMITLLMVSKILCICRKNNFLKPRRVARIILRKDKIRDSIVEQQKQLVHIPA